MFDKIDPGGETGSLSEETQDMPTEKTILLGLS